MFSHHTINFLWLIALLTPLAFLILSSPSTHGSFQAQYYEHKHNHEYEHTQRPRNILLLTAHPDDECMFFAPTILALSEALQPPSKLYSLCLSVGNADGLGDVRRRELEGSLDVLGIEEGRRWVVDKP